MQCSVHGGRIRGRVHRWNHRVMCGSCYRYFTRRVHVDQPRHAPRPARAQRRGREGSLIKALKALLG